MILSLCSWSGKSHILFFKIYSFKATNLKDKARILWSCQEIKASQLPGRKNKADLRLSPEQHSVLEGSGSIPTNASQEEKNI